MNINKLVCRVVGHNWDLFECKRCKKKNEGGLKKIAGAMAKPLKTPLNYSSIGRKFFKDE